MDNFIDIMTKINTMISFKFEFVCETMWNLRDTANSYDDVIKIDTAWSTMKIWRLKKLRRIDVFNICFQLLTPELQLLHIKTLFEHKNLSELYESI